MTLSWRWFTQPAITRGSSRPSYRAHRAVRSARDMLRATRCKSRRSQHVSCGSYLAQDGVTRPRERSDRRPSTIEAASERVVGQAGPARAAVGAAELAAATVVDEAAGARERAPPRHARAVQGDRV